MIKKMAWNTFKNTGDINTFLELKQIQDMEEKVGKGADGMYQLEDQIGSGANGMDQAEEQTGNEISRFCEQIGEQNGNNKNEWYNNI